MAYKTENKPDVTLAVPEGILEGVLAMSHGEVKHGRDNYLTNPKVTDNELVAAIGRHFLAILAARDPFALDGELKHTHLGAIIANCWMLLGRRATRAAKPAEAPVPPVKHSRGPPGIPDSQCTAVRLMFGENGEYYRHCTHDRGHLGVCSIHIPDGL